jgi:MinD-like ATPase involved in chromosome partitioning or flagellar assembly
LTRIVSVHSFRGGTGKSNITANLAVALAKEGNRVGVVDTDVQSPGIHVLFGLDLETVENSLNDYLWERCAIEETAHDVGTPLGLNGGGAIHLVPSSIRPGEIAKVLREGYDVGLLADGFRALGERLELDYLLIDTHPGVNEETLLAVTISEALIVVMRPDRQDFQGTAVTIDLAQKLEVPQVLLVLNKVPHSYDEADVRRQVTEAYGTPIAGLLHHDDELMALGSEGVFSLRAPEHPISVELGQLASRLRD